MWYRWIIALSLSYRVHKLWELREFFENRTILWWRHFRSRWCQIKTKFGVTRDFGLNFWMKKTDLDFGHRERPWSFCIEANFSILRLKKIDQKGPELDIKQQFYTKSTRQNPMSWSVFPDHEVGRSFKLIFKITNTLKQLAYKSVRWKMTIYNFNTLT